jgi:hypothetical protein
MGDRHLDPSAQYFACFKEFVKLWTDLPDMSPEPTVGGLLGTVCRTTLNLLRPGATKAVFPSSETR